MSFLSRKSNFVRYVVPLSSVGFAFGYFGFYSARFVSQVDFAVHHLTPKMFRKRGYISPARPDGELPVDLTGKLCIVTGASSGLGKATAEAFATKKARVIMACHDYDQCVVQRRSMLNDFHNKHIFCRQCDLQSFDSVRKCAEWVLRRDQPIACLVINAATKRRQRKVTKDGVESTPSSVVIVDCVGASDVAEIDFDDLNSEHYVMEGAADQPRAFRQSKLANVMFARELARRCEGSNVHVSVVSPNHMLRPSSLDREYLATKWWISRKFLSMLHWLIADRCNTIAQYVLQAAVGGLVESDRDLETEAKAARTTFMSPIEHGSRVVNGNSIPYPESAEDDKKRLRLWLTDELWTDVAHRKLSMYETLLAPPKSDTTKSLSDESRKFIESAITEQRNIVRQFEKTFGKTADPSTGEGTVSQKSWWQFW